MSESEETPRPQLRIVKGDPTPEELAALVAVVSSMGGGEAAAPKTPSAWSAHQRKLRPQLRHGLGGWRASSLPR